MNRRKFLSAIVLLTLSGCTSESNRDCPNLSNRLTTYCNEPSSTRPYIHSKSENYSLTDSPSFTIINNSFEPIRFGPEFPGRGLAKRTEGGWKLIEDSFTGSSAQKLERGESWSWKVDIGYSGDFENTIIPINKNEISPGKYAFYVQINSGLLGRRIIAKIFEFNNTTPTLK
ncbi:hypothetical protein ACH9L7_16590 (plasmid) [Haloferax sp. S1W]|uniref:hypothetical protein n=1 Tax=Haloferax sp. S1W TaxID=3377110 RepID=UPI0037CCC2B3